MKALVVEKPNVFSIQEVPYPEPGTNEVTIKVRACCICGTDGHLLRGEFGGVQYPLIPGHEFSGLIDKVGPGVSDFKIGDTVSIEPFIACGRCHFCQTGNYNVCLHGHVIGHSASRDGVRLDGGFAEYVTVPQKNLYRFQRASFHEAAFLPNLNTVVYGLRKAQFNPGDSILIIGAGTMGLLFVQLAKAAGARLIAISDRFSNRLNLAKELGAHSVVMADQHQENNLMRLTPYGFDVVVECVGHAKLFEQCFRYVRNRGKIILFGLTPHDQFSNINPFEISKRNLEIIGSFSATFCGPATRDLIDNGIIKIEPLVSHTFPLDEFPQALAKAQSFQQAIRVIVEP